MTEPIYFVALVILGLFNLIVLIVSMIWQSRRARELAILTSKLQHQVNKLSLSTDRSIVRLDRVMGLITGMQLAHQPLFDLPYYRAEGREMIITQTDFKTVSGSLTELIPLVEVIADKELSSAIEGIVKYGSQAAIRDMAQFTIITGDLERRLNELFKFTTDAIRRTQQLIDIAARA